MKNVTEKELKFAYHIWQKNYQFNFVDAEMSPFLQKEILSYSDNQSGWLSKTRRALFLSAQSQAERL